MPPKIGVSEAVQKQDKGEIVGAGTFETVRKTIVLYPKYH